MDEKSMSRLLSFLRDEIDKYNEPFSIFFKLEKIDQNTIKKDEVLDILQKAFVFFSIVEDLESMSPKWQSITSSQVYEIIRAIISLNGMPDKKKLSTHTINKITETELIGFLYVAHLLQFNGYQFSCKLRNTGFFPNETFRTFSTPMKIIKSWDVYIMTCQNHGRISAYQDLRNGMSKAMGILLPST